MRLIDADELKENMMISFDCENATKYGNKDAEQQAHSYSTLMLYEISNIVEDCINNAPTVEPTYISDMPDDKVKDLQELAIDYGEGIALFERKRPRGKWIEVTKGIDSNTYKCPFCGRLINCDKPRLKLYPFCHCGADMRGEKE